jgi:thioesterase domain-containing protein
VGRQDAVAAGTGPDELKGFRERRIAALFREVLGVEHVGATADFFELGGDERSALRLLDVIVEDSGVRLPREAMSADASVRGLARRVAETPATRTGTIVGFGTELPGQPLFCMMAAFQARTVARNFNALAGRPFYVVQQSGLEGPAPVDRSMRARARRAVDDIRSVQPHGPYSIAGYSNDANVALEAARLLTEMGECVDLIVVDMWAPVLGRLHRSALRVSARWKIVSERHPGSGPLNGSLRLALCARANLREVGDRLKWRALGRTAGRRQRPATLQTKLFAEVTKSAGRKYRARPCDLDVMVVRGAEFGDWEWKHRRTEPDLSWQRVTSGRVDVVPISGNHVTMIEDEGAPGLAQALAGTVVATASEAAGVRHDAMTEVRSGTL